MTLTLRRGDMVIFDGDSLTNRRSVGFPDTWPFLRLMNWDKPWPDMMAEMLFCWRPELRLSFFNAASAGSTCRDLAERIEHSVLARHPDWVIVSVAGNDARVRIPLAEFRRLMTEYAVRVTKETKAHVLFFGISRYGPDYPKDKAAYWARRCMYYRVLGDIARRTDRVHYVDIGPAIARKAHELKRWHPLHTIYSDDGHYNAVGNLMIAGEILRAFGIVH